MNTRISKYAIGIVAAASLALAPAAEAASLIRDAEIESTLRAYADPIFEAAGLDASAVQVHIIKDKQINAFVSGGLQMFVHTGLLTEAKSPNEVIGVIAHETGHIVGGHLARAEEAVENATIEMIVGVLAGVAIGVLTKQGGPAAATPEIVRMMALRDLMQYSREEEAAADQAAFHLLDKTGQSPAGMVSFFKVLEHQEALSSSQQDPFLRSHPLTLSRIDSAEAALARSPFAAAKDSPEMMMRHQRMLAKLNGYLQPLRVTTLYPETDQSVPARYARAIALFRTSHLKEAVSLMDGLLAEAPEDPFFIEQKAQILYENGRVADAVPLYRQALDLAPGEPLIRMELAEAQIQVVEMAEGKGERADPALLDAATTNLKQVVQAEPKNAGAYRLLAIAYGRSGDMATASLFQAEVFLALGKAKEAKSMAERALAGLPTGSPGWLRAQDIQFAADQRDDDGDEFTEPVDRAAVDWSDWRYLEGAGGYEIANAP